MNEVKAAWVQALEDSADGLERVLSIEEPSHPLDVVGIRANLSDGNAVAKAALNDFVEIFRLTAADLGSGTSLLRPETATQGLEALAVIEMTLHSASRNEIFRAAVMRALKPQREAVEKYGVLVGDVWRFREEDCDAPRAPFPDPPPDSSVRYK